MRRSWVVFFVLTACLSAPVILDACGDKFLLVGRGLAFGRAYASLYPGSILVYPGPQTIESYEKLAQQIRRAGHRVTVVSDDAMLGAALALGRTDILITDVQLRSTLEGRVTIAPLRPTVLYVVSEKDKQRAAQLHKAEPGALKSGEKPNLFLVHIEQLMKSRAQAGVRVQRG